MRYHLFQKFLGKMVEIKEMSFLFTRGMGLIFGNCMVLIGPVSALTLAMFNNQKPFFEL